MPTSSTPVPSHASRLRTVIAHDVDEHAHNLTNWEQRYDQVTPGRFAGSLNEWHADGVQIFHERSSRAVRQSCCVWPDAYWFGIEPQASGMRINGRQVLTGNVMTRPGHHEFELMTPDQHDILGIVIQRSTLEEAAQQHGCHIDWQQLAAAELRQVSPAALQACSQQIMVLLNGQHGSDEHVIMALLELLDHSQVDSEVCSSLARRRRIVDAARDYVMQHQMQAVTVPMLCEQLHVSRRTLQYCFEDVLGMSPMNYLRSLRLNGVRRQLRSGTASGQRIGDVAAAWGFTNFSQFSCDYKKMFGTSPSASQRG